MRQIRRNVFETNSSSTHSITMCSKAQFEDWKAGKVLFDSWKKTFVQEPSMTESDKYDAREHYRYTYENKRFCKKWEELSEDEINNWYKEYYRDHVKGNSDLTTYDEYFDYSDLETYTSSYTSESGDQIIAFGKYGYDG